MQSILITLCLCLTLPASAQTVVRSMQTTNNTQTMALNIIGKRDGRPFRHSLRFDVQGLSQAQRDSLILQTRQLLHTMGISIIYGLSLSSEEKEMKSAPVGIATTFLCNNCTGRGRIEIYGSDWLSTRSFNTKRDKQPLFPLTMHLVPGDYRYRLRRNGAWRVDKVLTLKAGENTIVTLN
jgi:hypothetical protein